jgi:hypothetical protein
MSDLKDAEMYIFPFLSRHPLPKKQTDDNEKLRTALEHYVQFYAAQMISLLESNGFNMNKKFLQDFDLTFEAFKSSLFRSYGLHHDLQDYVDEMYDEKEVLMIPEA